MTDEELQTLIRNACKAAGWPIKKIGPVAGMVSVWIDGAPVIVKIADDDGDSRLLQVACKIAIYFEVVGGIEVVDAYSQEYEDMTRMCATEPAGTMPLRATRMAVLRCAAMIGEAME